MVRGSAERDRQPEGAEARVDEVEEDRIFHREQPGEPGILRVAHRQPRLQAGDVAARREMRSRKPKLPRVRNVLGVIDAQKLTARFGQRQIERPRLGRRLARRRDDHLVARRQVEPKQAEDRLAVAALDDQLDVQFARRIVEPVEGGDELARHLGLFVERCDDGVGRQFVVREDPRASCSGLGDGRRRADDDGREEEEPQRGRGDRRERLEARCGEREREHGRKSRGPRLPHGQPAPGGQTVGKPGERVPENVARALRANERGEALRRRDGEAFRPQPAGRREFDQAGRRLAARRDHGPGGVGRGFEGSDAASEASRNIEVGGQSRRAEVICAADLSRQRLVEGFLMDDAGGKRGLEKVRPRRRVSDCGGKLSRRHARVDEDLEVRRQRRRRNSAGAAAVVAEGGRRPRHDARGTREFLRESPHCVSEAEKGPRS